MSDAADTDTELLEGKGGDDWVPDHNDFEAQRKIDLRRRVGQIVGTRESGFANLTKNTLNSVYAYLTGEFHFPPRDLNTQASPDKHKILRDVADEVGIDPSPWEKVGVEEEMADGSTQTVLVEPENPRTYLLKSELVTLAAQLKTRPDQREWTPDGDGGES